MDVLGIRNNVIDMTCESVKRWLPPISEEDKITLMNILTGTENTWGTPLLRKYIELLRPYTEILGISHENNNPREADCVASGIVFFYGCLFYIMHFENWGEHIEDIFLYNLLYILVDHYIDDINVDDSIKYRAISQMFILIEEPSSHEYLPLIDPVLKTIAIVYDRLINRCPSTKPIIIKLFKAEIEGISIQRNSNNKRNKYYDIALCKGGYTMEVLQHIVGDKDPTITKASYELGCIMQLIDDLNDVREDMKNNINTIATNDLKNHGILDNIWIDVVNRINSIDDRFTIFKVLYAIFAVYLPDRYPKNYSINLRNRTNPLNLFDYNHGCDGSSLLVNAIMNELLAMEILESI